MNTNFTFFLDLIREKYRNPAIHLGTLDKIECEQVIEKITKCINLFLEILTLERKK